MNKQFSEQEIDFGFSLTKEVFKGSVFGKELDISKIPPNRLTKLFQETYRHSAEVLRPLAQYQAQLVEHILDKTILKSVALISALAYELLLDLDTANGLEKAGAAMALVQIADHLMDRGDRKMVKAIERYFSGHTSDDDEIQARIAILEGIAKLASQTSHDEGQFVSDSMLEILRDEMAVYKLSKRYASFADEASKQSFLDKYASEIVNLSIRNVGLRPATYMIYSCYRRHVTGFPSLKEVIAHETIEPLIQYGEWAIRLWDDFGDQELDASQRFYTNSYIINPFVEKDEGLLATYLQVIKDQADYSELFKAMAANDELIKTLLASKLVNISAVLPEQVENDYWIYLTVLRRVIEAGYVNSKGDEAVSYSREIISDYA